MDKGKEQAQPTELSVILEKRLPALRKIAPKYVNVQRLISLAIEAKLRNPLLAQCSAESVINFCMKAAETGTDRIGAGGLWAVPFWNSKTGKYDMTPIPDWRLLIEKARRAKVIKHATADAVYANDFFEWERGLEPKLVHRPAKADRGDLTHVYCVFTLPDDTKDFVVMSWEDDIVPIRDRTMAWKSWLEKKRSNPWVTDPAEQAKKTVVKRALKIFEGASPELTKLIDVDNVINGFPELNLEEVPVLKEPKALTEEPIDTTPVPESKPQEPTTGQPPAEAAAPATSAPEPEQKPDLAAEAQKTFGGSFMCEDCTMEISKAEYDFSMGKYKAPLCRKCQKTRSSRSTR